MSNISYSLDKNSLEYVTQVSIGRIIRFIYQTDLLWSKSTDKNENKKNTCQRSYLTCRKKKKQNSVNEGN